MHIYYWLISIWFTVLPESLSEKSPNFWKPQKTYIKAISKSQKTYIKGLPKVKNIYIKALKFLLKTGLKKIKKKEPKKELNFKIAKSKYWAPNGSKNHPNGSKSPNLAVLLIYFRCFQDFDVSKIFGMTFMPLLCRDPFFTKISYQRNISLRPVNLTE